MLKSGTVLEARKVQTRDDRGYPISGYQVTENGPAIGMIIPEIDCEVQPPTPTYTEEEYKAIVADRDELANKLDAALREIAQHGRTINDLQKQQQAKEIPLPKLLVKALDYYKANDYLNLYGVFTAIHSESNILAEDARDILKKMGEDHTDILMKALVNGYRVQVAPVDQAEEILRCDIADYLQQWIKDNQANAEDVYEAAGAIVERMMESNKNLKTNR